MATVIRRPGRLFGMNAGRPHAPTLASLASVLPEYGKFTFDRTLEAARCDIGPHPDPANPDHARRLRVWLNQWLCRIGYPGAGNDVFTDSLASWWKNVKDSLPSEARSLSELSDGDLQVVSSAYGDLYVRPAATPMS